jgi:hypothetical protein
VEFVRFDETIRQKILTIASPDEETKLISEIASRVLEFQETNPIKCLQFFDRLTKLQQQTETGFVLVLQILSGSRAELDSYSKQSIKAGKSKQYIHAQRRRDIAKIEKIFPEIAKVVQDSIWKKRKL